MNEAARRSLIVNADDFGLSRGVNRGIMESHKRGIVTSASLMVRWPAAEEAAAHAREHPDLDLGLHIDLAEWVYRDADWVPLYQVVPEDDEPAVREEIARQFADFVSTVGTMPTHIDSHQHIHRNRIVRNIARAMGQELGVPVRHFCKPIQYCGAFYGQLADGSPYHQAITPDALLGVLAELSPGITELACHPGYADDLDTMYGIERAREVATLCDPRIRAALTELGIEMCTFRDVLSLLTDAHA